MTDLPRQSRLQRSLDTARNRYRAVVEKYLGPPVETPAAAVLPVPPRPVPEARLAPPRPLRPGGVELPADRRRWPEVALREFWSLVKWLNADARARGYAVEGRSLFAFADAEVAVRQCWRNPQPLGGAA